MADLQEAGEAAIETQTEADEEESVKDLEERSNGIYWPVSLQRSVKSSVSRPNVSINHSTHLVVVLSLLSFLLYLAPTFCIG